MIGERIKTKREEMHISQAELARKLGISRSSVNAWESGLSAPTAAYIIDLAKLFHCSSDYLLCLDDKETLNLDHYSKEERLILHNLISYFEKTDNKKNP